MKLLNKGKLPLRVTHNDTKLNNVMRSDTYRFGAATAAEDKKDLCKMELNPDRCRIQFKLVSDMEAKWDGMDRIVGEKRR